MQGGRDNGSCVVREAKPQESPVRPSGYAQATYPLMIFKKEVGLTMEMF